MRILLASLDSPATLQGGVEWYVHHLARALDEEGHEVKVLSRRPRAPAPPGVDYLWADLPPGETSHRYRLIHEPRFWRAVKREAAWADVVHGQNVDAVGALRVRPVVATVHTTPLDEWGSSRLGGWREWAYQREVEAYRRLVWRHFARRAAHVWTPGAHVAESLRRLGARSVEILANPVPPLRRMPASEARAALGVPPDGPLVVYLGRLAPVKRAHLVLEAAREVPGARVLVAGEGPERARVEAAAAAFGDRARLLGRVEDAQKEILLNAADAVVLPSEHEGQPLVLLEALALGTPIVATRAAWVPPELARFGHFGSDYARLLADALAMGRQEPAPVLDYRATARRMGEVYRRIGR